MLRAGVFANLIANGRLPRGLSYRQASFLTMLYLRPSLTRADFEALAGASHNAVYRDLRALLARGLVVRVGSGPACRYALV